MEKSYKMQQSNIRWLVISCIKRWTKSMYNVNKSMYAYLFLLYAIKNNDILVILQDGIV